MNDWLGIIRNFDIRYRIYILCLNILFKSSQKSRLVKVYKLKKKIKVYFRLIKLLEVSIIVAIIQGATIFDLKV